LLFQDVAKIANEYKDEELRGLFHRAHILHINFYEGWLSKEGIESDALAIKKFIEKIKRLLNNHYIQK
jgi:hypothetical protein